MFKNIPKHWNINPLSFPEISTIIMGQSPSSNTYNDTQEGLPFFQGKADFGDFSPTPRVWCSKPLKISQKDDILLSVRAPVGAINYNTETCCIGRGLAAIRAGKKLLPKYIYYFFKYYEPILKEEGSGAVFSAITKSFVENIRIPVPPTLEEQQEIVDVLDAASEIIRLRTACIESAQSLIPALFQEMFGDPINNNKNYPCESLKNLCSKIGSGATPRGGKESYLKEGISFVRSMNVHDGIFQYKDLAFINDEQAKLLDNVELQESDVLINITGASVARTCIVPKEILPARVNQHVSILRCTGRLNPYFLNVLLYFQTTKQKLLDLANSKGATREAITKQQLELFKIILPPIEQQELFAEKVQEIEAYIKTQHEELENAKAMFHSLLHHTFTGELTRHKFGGDANG